MDGKPFLFNPLTHREPGGGVPAGSTVSLRFEARGDVYLSGLTLCVTCERTKRETRYAAAFRGGDGYYLWEVSFTLPQSGLFWYYFIGHQDEHAFYICGDELLDAFATGILQKPWQITAYAPAPLPEWFFGGTMYHIFVDRFHSSRPKLCPPGRVLHEKWGETPAYLPVNGRILNNDFFGGDLEGITQKLDYLQGLGITALYLSPIFEAASNHRYDTGDYERIDPMLGDEADFTRLTQEAQKRGMAVILDGVFNHTGDDSRYFNRYGRYASLGAYQSPDSPYRGWYRFNDYPNGYRSWWGIDTLPSVDQDSRGFSDFIAGKNGIAARWLKAGAAGWRLDVVDELHDGFLDRLCETVKRAKPDAVIIGEVWEDASNKIAYGVRRRYFEGGQLDSVMNYPAKNAIIDFVRSGNSLSFVRVMGELADHYPPHVLHMLMNLLSTHDTMRILTVLGESGECKTRAERAAHRLAPSRRASAKKLLKLASLLQFTIPGVPCVYYGDEAGLEGYEDPFNRRCFPWGEEDAELTDWYRFLGGLRRHNPVLARGGFRFLRVLERCVCYSRGEGDELIVGINRGSRTEEISLTGAYESLLEGETAQASVIRQSSVAIAPDGMALLKKI